MGPRAPEPSYLVDHRDGQTLIVVFRARTWRQRFDLARDVARASRADGESWWWCLILFVVVLWGTRNPPPENAP